MFQFHIVPCVVGDSKYLVIFKYRDTPPVLCCYGKIDVMHEL